ncbi:MAG: NAD(P)-dependent oxidoreductase [Betaproteobacteria bacterium]|nr:MAG: NAD(P)-dependent oxidoreductase [Betaproteobacteria bacterium]
MRVGFIGVGAMGEPMAANLLKKGFEVSILQHRRAEPVARLSALGATAKADVAQAVQGCEVIVLSLPTSREVEAVMAGSRGIVACAQSGSVVVDCSTSDPQSTRALGKQLGVRGIGLVDAGMTRGVAGAKQGTLAFFLGGEQRHIERAMPVLKALGDTFVHLGPSGDGHTAKVISNVLSYGTVALVNEAFMLGARAGLDLKVLYDALMQGAPSKALESFGPRIASGDYEPPRVTIEHVCEDLVLAQSMAASGSAPIFMLSAAQEIYRLLALRGEGAADMSKIAQLWRDASAARE